MNNKWAGQMKRPRLWQWPGFVCYSLLSSVVFLSGCETANKVSDGLGGVTDKALETIGFKKPVAPETPEALKPPRQVSLRLAPSEALNVDPAGRSLSLVTRVYKLRGTTAFLNAPQEVFGNPIKEKEAFGGDLVDSFEVILLPGKPQQINEKWPREITHVAVVGLFRSAASQRWRYAFQLDSVPAGEGIILGAHACGFSVASGNPVGMTSSALKLQAPICSAGVLGGQPAGR